MSLPPPDELHTTDQAAEALNVPAALIRKWRHTGDAKPAGVVRASVPGGLQPLYMLEELQPLADRYHKRRRR